MSRPNMVVDHYQRSGSPSAYEICFAALDQARRRRSESRAFVSAASSRFTNVAVTAYEGYDERVPRISAAEVRRELTRESNNSDDTRVSEAARTAPRVPTIRIPPRPSFDNNARATSPAINGGLPGLRKSETRLTQPGASKNGLQQSDAGNRRGAKGDPRMDFSGDQLTTGGAVSSSNRQVQTQNGRKIDVVSDLQVVYKKYLNYKGAASDGRRKRSGLASIFSSGENDDEVLRYVFRSMSQILDMHRNQRGEDAQVPEPVTSLARPEGLLLSA
ncbi:unnamed protein product [Amoebophrya sp. A25]|nr:unnamed protein product [Amoebophrya sp. A25]|eukprot:GSA25T00022609001.1